MTYLTHAKLEAADHIEGSRAYGRERPIWVQVGINGGEELSVFVKPNGEFEIERHHPYGKGRKIVAKGKLAQKGRAN